MSFLSFVRTLSGGSSSGSNGSSNNSSSLTRSSSTSSRTNARSFTLAEVAKHNTESDCYTIVEGHVYDVTKYLHLHPGGYKLLFKNAGADSTSDFLALRHSAKSRVILDAYYVGELVSNSRATLNPNSAAAASSSSSASNAASAPPRKVGAAVGPQPFLSVAPPTSTSATPVPTSSSSSLAHVYPPPRPSALHPSTSHPDRLTAYATFQNEHNTNSKDSEVSISLIPPTGGMSINLLPPSSSVDSFPPRHAAPASSASSTIPCNSPTSRALEEHLSHSVTTPSSSDESATPPPKPTKLLFGNTRVIGSGDLATFKVGAGLSAVASPFITVTAPPASQFGPRLFSLKHRVQRTHNVQLLTFEPVFAATAAASSASSTIAASSTVATPSSSSSATSHVSSDDPVSWFHIPCGLHISLGCTLPDGTYVKRPYTPISNQRGEFELLVKSYPYGIVSKFLHQLPLHTSIEVFGPAGRFEYDLVREKYQKWCMIAQGTGIAPLWQLVRHVLDHDQDSSLMTDTATTTTASSPSKKPQMYLLDCNRAVEDILLRDELHSYQQKSHGGLVIQHLLSQQNSEKMSDAESNASSSAGENILYGRLNASLLQQYLSTIIPLAADSSSSSSSISSTIFLLCGSDEFHSDVTQLLRASPLLTGLKEDQIFCF